MGTISEHEKKIRKLDIAQTILWGVYNLAVIYLLFQPGLLQGVGAGLLAGEAGFLVGEVKSLFWS